jgi:hypothetical protein
MPKPYSSGVVPASADEVWAVMREFNRLPDWHPLINESRIESGSAQEVGAIRRLTLADGGQVAERLVALDDDERPMTYAFTDPGAMPVRSYKSTLRVAPVTANGQAFVEWWAWFDSDADVEEEMAKTYREGVYAAGIEALIHRFGG